MGSAGPTGLRQVPSVQCSLEVPGGLKMGLLWAGGLPWWRDAISVMKSWDWGSPPREGAPGEGCALVLRPPSTGGPGGKEVLGETGSEGVFSIPSAAQVMGEDGGSEQARETEKVLSRAPSSPRAPRHFSSSPSGRTVLLVAWGSTASSLGSDTCRVWLVAHRGPVPLTQDTGEVLTCSRPRALGRQLSSWSKPPSSQLCPCSFRDHSWGAGAFLGGSDRRKDE